MRGSLLLRVALLLWIGMAFARTASDVMADEASSPSSYRMVEWRRTDRGWERIAVAAVDGNSIWTALRGIHPSIVGAFQLLVSVGALVGFASERELRRPLFSFFPSRTSSL